MTCNERFVLFYIYPKPTLPVVCNLTKREEPSTWGGWYFLAGISAVERTQCSEGTGAILSSVLLFCWQLSGLGPQ